MSRRFEARQTRDLHGSRGLGPQNTRRLSTRRISTPESAPAVVFAETALTSSLQTQTITFFSWLVNFAAVFAIGFDTPFTDTPRSARAAVPPAAISMWLASPAMGGCGFPSISVVRMAVSSNRGLLPR